MGTILTYLGLAKHVIPVIDAVVAEVESHLPAERQDVKDAWAVFQKTFTDFKAALESLIGAVKKAIASS